MNHIRVLAAFAGHMVSALFVFAVVGAGAWAVHMVRIALGAYGLDGIIETGLHALELLLFGCDVTATAAWSIMSTIRAIRDIFHGRHHE